MSVYPFIEAERVQQRIVKRACELLEVSRAAYYAHRAGTVSARQRTDAELTEHIHQAHKASKGRYGAPRIHAELRRRGHRHGRKRIARLMRAASLRNLAVGILRAHGDRNTAAAPGYRRWPVIRLPSQTASGRHAALMVSARRVLPRPLVVC